MQDETDLTDSCCAHNICIYISSTYIYCMYARSHQLHAAEICGLQ